jgi:DNA-binding ferritin-like protein
MQNAPAEKLGMFVHLVSLERDMVAALQALRSRMPRAEHGQLDQLLSEHADRLPFLEEQVRALGGQPPDPAERPAELPRDPSDIAMVSDTCEAVRALADDHEALADAYREALSLPEEDEEARSRLMRFASEMEQHSARLAALLPTV